MSSKEEKDRADAAEAQRAADKKAATKHAADAHGTPTAADKAAQKAADDAQAAVKDADLAVRKANATNSAEASAVEDAKPTEYPRWVHHPTQPSVLVQSEREWENLGSGWTDAPTSDVPAEPVVLSAERLAEIKAEAEAKLAAEAAAKAKAGQ